MGPGADGPADADALRSQRAIWIDAGTRDEWYLDLGAEAFRAELAGPMDTRARAGLLGRLASA